MPALAPEFALASALNALLARQPAAAGRLARHQGKTLQLALPVFPLTLLLADAGRFQPMSADAAIDMAPDLTLIPDPAAVPLWLTGGKLADLFRAEGDGVLATDIAGALAEFDWVLALRPYLGDIVASRIDQLIQGVTAWRADAVASAGRNLAEYAVHEQAMLAEPHAVREFIAGVDRLREDSDRLAARLAQLENRSDA